MTAVFAPLRRRAHALSRLRRLGLPALASVLLVTAPGCWGYLAHEVAPESVTDPLHEFEQLVRDSPRPPNTFEVFDEFAKIGGFAKMGGWFGYTTLTYSQMAALEIRTRRQRYLVDVFDARDHRVARFEQANEASARRLCDVLSALHSRSIHSPAAAEANQ